MAKLLALGSIYLDINCPGLPFDESGLIPERDLTSGQYIVEPGGSAVNFARVCSRLGLETTLVGKTGNDQPAAIIENMLQDDAVAARLIKQPDRQTNLSVNLINPAGHTIMLSAGSANQSLTADEALEQLAAGLESIDYLYLGSSFKLPQLLPDCPKIVNAAHANGVKVILDHARPTQLTTAEEIAVIKQLALQADYYFPSRTEFLSVWGIDSIESGLRALQNQTAARVVVKDSRAGAWTMQGNDLLHTPAFSAALLHTVGAGDSFNAGFIAAQAQGSSLADSLRFANATAALKISQTELPDRSQVEALLAEQPE